MNSPSIASQFFQDDIFFRKLQRDFLSFHKGRPDTLLSRLGLLMIKPDGVVSKKMGRVVDYLDKNQFKIINAASVELTRTMIRNLWRDERRIYSADRLNFSDCLYGSAEAVVFLVLDSSDSKMNGSVRLTELKGPAEVSKREPWHLRSILGSPDMIINYVHTANSTQSVFRELAILFNRSSCMQLFESRSRQEVVDDISRIEASYPKYHFNFNRALASIEVPDEVRAKIISGELIPFNTLLDAFQQFNGRDRLWDLVTVAKETVDLELSLTRTGIESEAVLDAFANLNIPTTWVAGVRAGMIESQSVRTALNDVLSPYTDPASVFRVQSTAGQENDWR